MVRISCSGKFHAFNLAEELEKNSKLESFWTTYYSKKNIFFNKFVSRKDSEIIPIEKVHTNIPLAIAIKSYEMPHLWNEIFDRWVCRNIEEDNEAYKIFIGWSGMSSNSLKRLKSMNKITILERGSAHILHQNQILKEEYKKFGKEFTIEPNVIKKELEEYDIADFISIPSLFVKNSFVEYGISENKLFLNNYGSDSSFFTPPTEIIPTPKNKFRILYLGRLSIQKGLIYLFEALELLKKKYPFIEATFIGSIDDDFNSTVLEFQRRNNNWTFHGHTPHSLLLPHLHSCDVAVQSSLQDGFSMVIAQLLSAGLPVITTTNTGGKDLIKEGENGFVIPIRSAQAIESRISDLIDNPDILFRLKKNLNLPINPYSWDDYGVRWNHWLNSLQF